MRNDADDMWRVIYIAHSARKGDDIEMILQDEGFLVRKEPLTALSETCTSVEIRVLKSEANEARNFLSEKGL